MNIFVLDENPEKAAQMLCDKHIVKMILESAQMLCTAHWQTGSKAPYKQTHVNHPCTIWTRTSLGNYNWLVRHSLELCNEYTKRYEKKHKTEQIIKWCKEHLPFIKKKQKTSFVQAMPEEYKDKDSVKAYKKYYIGEKKRFAKWKKGNVPGFMQNS